MGFYSSTALELLCRLIQRDNPQHAGRISADSIGECTIYYDKSLSSNTVADVTTASNSFANKAYGRAVIQTDVEAAGVKGIAYFTITAKNRPRRAYFLF